MTVLPGVGDSESVPSESGSVALGGVGRRHDHGGYVKSYKPCAAVLLDSEGLGASNLWSSNGGLAVA